MRQDAWPALLVLLAAAGAFVLWETRGTYFWYDEWLWITERHGLTADAFLEPHNQHLSLIPVAIYRALFAIFGVDHYWPFRVVLVACHLTCGVALFLYARSRVGAVLGIAAAALLLFLGSGWNNILWPFQLAWLISVAAGLGALMALDRRERRADVAAAVLLGISLASSGVGIPFVVTAAVDVALERRRWRDGLIVAAPLSLYLLWWVLYQTAGPQKHLALVDVPLYVLRSASAAVLGLFGLLRDKGPVFAPPDVPLIAGVPLLVALVALAGWRLYRLGRVPARVVALVAGILTFWVATAIQRGIAAPASTSRYVYVGSFFVLLLAVETARGLRVRPLVAGAAALIALAAVAANVPLLRDAGAGLRADGDRTRIAIGLFEMTRQSVRPSEPLTMLPGYPLVVITAGEYFASVREWGDFRAAPPAEIAAAAPENRLAADRELARIEHAVARPVAWRRARGAAPRVDATAGGVVRRDGSCVVLTATASAESGGKVDLTVPPSGLLVRSRGGATKVGIRRFAHIFVPDLEATVPSGKAAELRIAADGAPQPWRLHVSTDRTATLCPA